MSFPYEWGTVLGENEEDKRVTVNSILPDGWKYPEMTLTFEIHRCLTSTDCMISTIKVKVGCFAEESGITPILLPSTDESIVEPDDLSLFIKIKLNFSSGVQEYDLNKLITFETDIEGCGASALGLC